MTELKYLKNIAETLMGIHRELRRHNELVKRNNELMACGFVYIADDQEGGRVLKNEIIGDMETGKPDDV